VAGPGSAELGVQLGDAMARASRDVESLARSIGATPVEVRRWLSGEELPSGSFVLRMLTPLFTPGSIEWLAFRTAYFQARGRSS
jgi:hypothetical protein